MSLDYKDIEELNPRPTSNFDIAQNANNEDFQRAINKIKVLLEDIDRRLTAAGL